MYGTLEGSKKSLRYLQRTTNFMVTYKKLEELEIIGYSDSDFFGCIDSKKSTAGYSYLLAGRVVSWKSAKQALIASLTISHDMKHQIMTIG